MTKPVRRRAFILAGATAAAASSAAFVQETKAEQNSMSSSLEHINPDSMHGNPAFSQGIIIPAGARILVIGGQNAVDASGDIVGKGDIATQTTKAVENLVTVLEGAGGTLDGLVRIGLLLREDVDLEAGFGAWMAGAGGRIKNPPTVTTAMVAKLAHPDFLVEIEATAVLP